MSTPESVLRKCEDNEQLLDRLVSSDIMTIPEANEYRRRAAAGEDAEEFLSVFISRYTNGQQARLAAAYVRRHRIKARAHFY